MATKKAKKTANTTALNTEPLAPVPDATPETEIPAPLPTTGIVDPIGDTTDGEAKVYLGEQAPPEIAAEETPPAATESNPQAEAAEAEVGEDSDREFTPNPRPPAKLERLQKILARAGVASRRKAEEMIEQGRVQVNGTVVTELGTKADGNRDHIRVDGKLLHGAERLRYFVLNKPKGFVTTVKDPEGRPTVMQFFDKMHERLYPVGRLDYMSEGLLLVTNDGELANKLTKAGSGVEKVYLVKVAGQPSEAELEILRGGVAIERGKPGSPQVRTSPARVRQVRQGDNPWYEVVLIEGRNRELRKMFSAVGHFVEKIRRVGYGPLVLDQEPGNMRELQPEELAALRLASEGKLRTPKAKQVRRRNLADSQLPTVQPKPSRPRSTKPFDARKPAKPFSPRGFDEGPAAEGFRPAAGRNAAEPAKSGGRNFGPARPAWKKDDRTSRPPARFAAGAAGEAHPPAGKPYGDRPATGRAYGSKPAARTFGSRPFAGKPASGRPAPGKTAWTKPGSSERPPFKPQAPPRREASAPHEEFPEIRPGGLRIDPVEPGHSDSYRPEARSRNPVRSTAGRPPFDRPRAGKPSLGKPRFDKPRFEKSSPPKPRFDKPGFQKPGFEKPRFGRSGEASAEPSRPPRGQGGLARPFTTSSGKPRTGGARPSSKPFKPGGHSSSKPRPGGFSKSGPKRPGFKGNSGGAKRSRPGSSPDKRG